MTSFADPRFHKRSGDEEIESNEIVVAWWEGGQRDLQGEV